jgi:DDE superfamily endonuclease
VAPHIPCRIQPAYHKLLSFVWLMGNTESFRSVADRFGESRGSLHLYITQVVEAFQKIATNYIHWPETEMELSSVCDEFEKMHGVIGCVDGTYIPVSGKSGEKRNAYICRKGFPAMHAQITCTSKMKITDITTGYPGSVHDARVFRNSSLLLKLQNLSPNFHVLADSAYPLETYMLTPFKDTGKLTAVQNRYNYLHSSSRCCVERCIGLLKGKFRKLKNFEAQDHVLLCRSIVACAVLHNFILTNETLDENDIVVDNDEAGGAQQFCHRPSVSAVQKRWKIAAEL